MARVLRAAGTGNGNGFTPGPNTTLSTALGANHGLRHALPFVCAVPLGWAILLALCSLGLGALMLAVPALAWAVKLTGVGYLLWMAWNLASVRAVLATQAQRDWKVSPWRLFVQGVALQFVNIKAWMLALAIVGGWVAGHADPLQRFLVVLPVMIAYAFASNLVYAMVGSLLRSWLAGPHGSGRRLQWFNRAMAGVLLATAVGMLAL